MNRARQMAFPVLAIAMVAVVLGVQLAHGGGSFEPVHTADPCAARRVGSQAKGIEGLTERLVLLGVDGAACRLHVSREAFTLDLASARRPSAEQIDALRAGLKGAVRRMKSEGSLPKASTILGEVLDSLDLNPILEAAIQVLPDGVVDAALRTDDVLDRTIDGLDLRALLGNLDDEHGLEQQIQVAVIPAVKDSLVDRLRHLV